MDSRSTFLFPITHTTRVHFWIYFWFSISYFVARCRKGGNRKITHVGLSDTAVTNFFFIIFFLFYYHCTSILELRDAVKGMWLQKSNGQAAVVVSYAPNALNSFKPFLTMSNALKWRPYYETSVKYAHQ